MDELESLESLEFLSLVSKISSELQNHLGIPDNDARKTLAEFVIAKRLECDTFDEFQKMLPSMGASTLPNSLVESIDRLVCTLHPKFKNKKPPVDQDAPHRTIQEKEQIFKGLSIPDLEPTPNGDADEIDDTLALLEGLAPKTKQDKPQNGSRKRSRSPGDDDDSRRRRKDRHQDRDRSRSRSRDRKRDYYNDDETHRRGRKGRHEDDYGNGDSRKKHRSTRGRFDDDNDDEEDDDQFRRPPLQEVDDTPQLYKVYDGHVTGIKDFGAFVNLHGVRGKVDGLVHVSALVEGQRVNHPSDLVSKGQPVKVKVVKMEGSRIGLSMKEVDQETGQDLKPHARIQLGAKAAKFQPKAANSKATGANSEALGGGGVDNDFMMNGPPPSNFPLKKQKKRMASPERWEIRQLIASGVAKASDYPDLEEDYNAALTGEGQMELEQDVDIEIRDEEPPFLAGQTKQSLELSPIRIIKAPDGSLNRAAMAGTNLAKERKEMRREEVEAKEQDAKVDLQSQWQDPMADPDKRRFASDMRQANMRNKNEAAPEWRQAIVPKDASLGKRTNMTIKQQRETLPVFSFRDQLIEAIKSNQILIVVGETGSGKTTQLTQYLAESGFGNNGIIGCTQPRRVAAISVAKRVSEEVGCELGSEVGYAVRFDDRTSRQTVIKYMTDGHLQREIIMDPDLKRYSVIMLDEAHERTIATDVLFGLLKKAVKRRPDLKIIVTSATLDADKFSSYFHEAPIFTIPGRTYPVEVLYSKEPESDYLDAALVTVMEIHLSEPAGDILVFLTGQEEIDTACEVLYERMKALGPNVPELIILPVYSALPSEMQSRIFDPAPPGSRKVVLATNIAETSITIDGIYYVVDPGFVKQNAYDPKLGMDSLVVVPISRASAQQRAGRAGRTGPGKCFRLYTQQAFETEMLPTTIPEIQRQNLAHTILMLKASGINDLLHFGFMDPPPMNTMLTALEELYALSALDDEGLLTRLGRKMADFPVDPSLAKALVFSVDLGCSDEMLTIVSMLNIQTVFYRPKEKQSQADQKKAKFHDPHGDHLTLLNVYNSWKLSGFSNAWCFENFIQARGVRRAKDVRDQLTKMMTRYRHPIVSAGRDTELVRRALCSGFFRNSARKDPQEGYRTLIEGTHVYLHPSSALFGKNAEWVIYHSLVMTTKEYMHITTAIEPKWLVEAAPTFFKVAPTDKLSKRKKTERIQPLYNKFQGEDDWRLSAQRRAGRSGGGGGTWG